VGNPCGKGEGDGGERKIQGYMDEVGSIPEHLPFLGNRARKLVGFINTNKDIHKHMDTNVAFTQEYFKVSIFHMVK
jgi:hypothetical protein